MGFKIKTIQTDNGREFVNEAGGKRSSFELKLDELGIEYRRTRPCSHWQNGKVERVIDWIQNFMLESDF